MKKTLVGLLALVLFTFSVVGVAEARTTRVGGYYKPSKGIFVQPHYRTSPNKSLFDNYSTKGNYNPFTGKKGHVNPFK